MFDWKAYLRENFPDTEIPEDSVAASGSESIQGQAGTETQEQAISQEETR